MDGASGGFVGHNVSISYNTLTRIHRIGIEIQGTSNYPSGCPGGCLIKVSVAGLQVKGNYVHLPAWAYYNTYGYSLAEAATGSNDQFLNNTAIGEPASPGQGNQLAYGMELAHDDSGELIQGSVIASGLPNNLGWNPYLQTYPSGSTNINNTFTNNLLCGTPSSGTKIGGGGKYSSIANNLSSTCPAGVGTATSSIVSAFTSANNQSFPTGGNGTWSLYVISNLSIRYVQFFLDGSNTPIATQELQDVNTNFANDRKWFYHGTINTSSLAAGTHTVTATTTDVSGVSQTVNQSFLVGYSGGSRTLK
jgi:hypothetical protein